MLVTLQSGNLQGLYLLEKTIGTAISNHRLSNCQRTMRSNMVQGKRQIPNNTQIPISNDPNAFVLDFGH
jgi:hypothetical protein